MRRPPPRTLIPLVGLLAVGALPACDPGSGGAHELRTTVQLVAEEHGEVADRALLRLVAYAERPDKAREALSIIEAALHRAPPRGRRTLVTALRRIGLAESCSLIGHVAAFDTDAAVAFEARRTLELWAANRSEPVRAARSVIALRKADDARGFEAAEY